MYFRAEYQFSHLWPSLSLYHLDELSSGSVIEFKELQTVIPEHGHQVQADPAS